ncbi:hypothetical protein KKF55_05215 [Patescibacteria group bacterium]|nr:hypothetical protein [Patescibacteria group bacterium]
MAASFFRRIRSLDLEEQILNGGALLALIGVFLPWTGGFMLGSDAISHSGFGFYTSFIGIAIFLVNLFVILITLIPLSGGPSLIRRHNKEHIRLFCGLQSTILTLAALSVITKVTLQFSRMEIRFGIIVTLIGGIAVILESFLRMQEERKSEVHDFFHHTEEKEPQESRSFSGTTHPPPLPPPPPPNLEEHRIHP